MNSDEWTDRNHMKVKLDRLLNLKLYGFPSSRLDWIATELLGNAQKLQALHFSANRNIYTNFCLISSSTPI